MPFIKYIPFLFSLNILFMSCQKDLIVKDITDKTVTALSPPDGYRTPNNSVTFWWEKVDGAEKYNVQIVSPSFSNIQQLITDTSVASDKYAKVLMPGTYRWRVRGVNNGGETAWTTRTLTIDTSSNLTYSSVILLSPVDSFYSNSLIHTFTWAPVSNATLYALNVLSTNYSYSSTSASITLPAEGSYLWKVRAENSFSFSPYSSRVIVIDQTAPTTSPSLIYPITTTIAVPSDTLMKWSKISDSYKDIIFVSDQSDFSTTTKIDTVSAASAGFRTYSISNFTTNSGSTYYWKVKCADRAGNVGNYGPSKSFRVQ